MSKLEKCELDSSTLRELGSHLNNQNARSLINYTSVLLEHGLFTFRDSWSKLVTSRLSSKDSWSPITPAPGLDVAHGTSSQCWPSLHSAMQDIHTTPPSFLHVDHPEVSPSLTFLVASNRKPLLLTWEKKGGYIRSSTGAFSSTQGGGTHLGSSASSWCQQRKIFCNKLMMP